MAARILAVDPDPAPENDVLSARAASSYHCTPILQESCRAALALTLFTDDQMGQAIRHWRLVRDGPCFRETYLEAADAVSPAEASPQASAGRRISPARSGMACPTSSSPRAARPSGAG